MQKKFNDEITKFKKAYNFQCILYKYKGNYYITKMFK